MEPAQTTISQSDGFEEVPQGVTCPNCAYDLANLPGRVCPECGHRFRLEAVPQLVAVTTADSTNDGHVGDVPVGVRCPNKQCGYDLSGLSNRVCPECGNAFRLTSRLANGRQWKFRVERFGQALLGLVGLVLANGFGHQGQVIGPGVVTLVEIAILSMCVLPARVRRTPVIVKVVVGLGLLLSFLIPRPLGPWYFVYGFSVGIVNVQILVFGAIAARLILLRLRTSVARFAFVLLGAPIGAVGGLLAGQLWFEFASPGWWSRWDYSYDYVVAQGLASHMVPQQTFVAFTLAFVGLAVTTIVAIVWFDRSTARRRRAVRERQRAVAG